MCCPGAPHVSKIAFPYCAAIGVLHDLITWKVIYVIVSLSPFLSDCSQKGLGPGVGYDSVYG